MEMKAKGKFGDISKCRDFDDIPSAAKEYVCFIEDYTGLPEKFIGVGADRNAMIIRE